MIVVKVVPFWRIGESSVDFNDHSVLIEVSLEPSDISVAEELSGFSDKLSSLVLDVAHCLGGYRSVTNTLEELDAFFSLKFLQVTVLFYEVLLLLRNSLVLQR